MNDPRDVSDHDHEPSHGPDPADRAHLDDLAALWRERDPVPEGLVARMQALARTEAELVETDWDHELLQLVERSTELVGARSGTGALTLRFAEGDVELLVRIVDAGDGPRLDGWVVPATAMTVTVLDPAGSETGPGARVDATGRFELTGLAHGLVRLRLDPDPDRPDGPDRPDSTGGPAPVLTPTFEI